MLNSFFQSELSILLEIQAVVSDFAKTKTRVAELLRKIYKNL